MSDSLIWVSAQLHDVYVQMWWQEARQTSVRGTGAPPPLWSATCSGPDAASAGMHATPAATLPVAQAAPAVASPWRGSQGWGSSSDEGDSDQCTSSTSQRFPSPWVCSSSQPPPHLDVRLPTTPPVSLLPGLSRVLPRMPTARSLACRPVDCPLRLRVDDAFGCLREDVKDWFDWWRSQLSCSASRHATLVSHLHADREAAPEFF